MYRVSDRFFGSNRIIDRSQCLGDDVYNHGPTDLKDAGIPLLMKDSTNRRLLIIFALSILLSIGAIAIGFMGMVDLLDAGFVDSVKRWIEPVVAIRSDSPPLNSADALSALDVEATQMVEKQDVIKAIYAEWPIIFSETFITNDLGWPVFEEDADLAKLSVEIENGRYQWQARANEGFVWWAYPDMDPLDNFFAEIEVTQNEGGLNGELGLVFRLSDDQYYLYEVSGGEYFSLWRSDPDGWSELFAWTASSAIKSTGKNKLGVLAQDDRFYLFINDQLVAEVEDNQLAAGVVGVAIGLDEADTEGFFEFDNLILSAP